MHGEMWAFLRCSHSGEPALLNRSEIQPLIEENLGAFSDGLYITHTRAYSAVREVTFIDSGCGYEVEREEGLRFVLAVHSSEGEVRVFEQHSKTIYQP